MGPKSKWA